MIAGIVGSEASKFTDVTMIKAIKIITEIMADPLVTFVSSGHCHLGGIDIWAEDIAKALGKYDSKYIFPPRNLGWQTGYKPRNIQIAEASDVVHCITLKELPPSYNGMRFPKCYHCNTNDHVKSGGCWTVRYAMKLGKEGVWHII